MAPKRTSNLFKVGFGLLLGITIFHVAGWAIGWLEKKITEREQVYWKNLEKAIPLIRQRADSILTQLGYNPDKLTADVAPKGEGGDEIWTVKYWHTPPLDYTATVVTPGDLAVYLNNQGRVRRVMKYGQDAEQLLYGKDERIEQGMTPEEVRMRLGEPDHIGPPQREIRDLADETWTYKASPAGRTMTIEVDFKDGKVFSFSRIGK